MQGQVVVSGTSGSAGPPNGVQFQQSGVLAQAALQLLAAGPTSTAEVAQRVLGIPGTSGAAARAVFALLGADPRFTVSAAGVWSLAGPAAPSSCALADEEYVVVDVETTGGSPGDGHRVTEIAAVRVSGGQIRESFSSLVNPGRPIPSMIQSLTGITNGMVRNAPRFSEVAADVAAMVEGRIFTAHNAPFDWRFVCHEMEHATGSVPAGRRLCTVRVARKLLPSLTSRSLDSLALYFGLEIESRHRALDDAVATAHVLLHFLRMLDSEDVRGWEELERFLSRRASRTKRTASPRSMKQA